MAAASRQWWKASNPPEVASRLVCHKGSVLGPLLFLVYYRDLPSVTSSSTTMFADDTQLYDRCLNSPNHCNCRISEDLERISNWANQWDTTFNASKSMHMFFKPSPTKTWDVADIDSGCCRDPLHGANTPSWCGADIEPKVDGPCSIADPKAKFSCLCAQTACPASKLGCYRQAPIRRPRSTCPGIRLPCMGWLPKARLCCPRAHSAGSRKSSFTLFTS